MSEHSKSLLQCIALALVGACSAEITGRDLDRNPDLSSDYFTLSKLASSTVGYNRASITWETDQEAFSKIEFGVTANYGTFTVASSSPSRHHSFVIDRLAPETLHHFRMHNWDSEGHYSRSSDQTVETPKLLKIRLGSTHALALKPDGSVYSWGANASLQLGRHSTDTCFSSFTCSTQPAIVPNLSNAIQIGAGNIHSAALKGDGTVWSFGSNNFSQLGNGSAGGNSQTPVQAIRNGTGLPLTQVSSIGLGLYHTMAKLNDGSVVAWGRNSSGQLGNPMGANCDSTLVAQATAVPVLSSPLGPGDLLVGGGHFSFALSELGVLSTWGYNPYGQLARSTAFTVECAVLSAVTDVRTVAAGLYHALAIKSDGVAYAWGYDGYQQLGNGPAQSSSVTTPAPVIFADNSLLSNVIQIAAGDSMSYALTSEGKVYAWGEGQYGALGNGTTVREANPVQVLTAPGTPLNDVIQIEAKGEHVFAIRGDGSIWAWGYNGYGQLGLGQATGPDTCVLGYACSKYAVQVPAF